MNFKIDGKPVGKGRPRFTRNGQTYTPEKTKEYEKLIRTSYSESGGTLLDGYINISISAYYQIPKAFSREKKEFAKRGIIKPVVRPDLDNVVKAILDGLNGIAYHDDSQVISIVAVKCYSEEPRVEVSINAGCR